MSHELQLLRHPRLFFSKLVCFTLVYFLLVRYKTLQLCYFSMQLLDFFISFFQLISHSSIISFKIFYLLSLSLVSGFKKLTELIWTLVLKENLLWYWNALFQWRWWNCFFWVAFTHFRHFFRLKELLASLDVFMLHVQLLADKIELCSKLKSALFSYISLASFYIQQHFMLLIFHTPCYPL